MALYLVNATPEPQSGCDTLIPMTGISDETFNYTLSTIISGTEDGDSLDTFKMRPKYYDLVLPWANH